MRDFLVQYLIIVNGFKSFATILISSNNDNNPNVPHYTLIEETKKWFQ